MSKMRGSLNDNRRFFTMSNHGNFRGSNRASYPQYNARKEIEAEESKNFNLINKFDLSEQHSSNTNSSEIKGGLINRLFQKLKGVKDALMPSQARESVIEDNQTQLEIKAPFLKGADFKKLLVSHTSNSRTTPKEQLQLFSTTNQQQINNHKFEDNRTIQVNINLWSSPAIAQRGIKFPLDDDTLGSSWQTHDPLLIVEKDHADLQRELDSCLGFTSKQLDPQPKSKDKTKSKGLYFMLSTYHQIHDDKLSKVFNKSRSSFSLNKASWLTNLIKQHARKPEAIKPRYSENEKRYLPLFQFKVAEGRFRYELIPQNWTKKRRSKHDIPMNFEQTRGNSQELQGVFAQNAAILEREELLCHGTKKSKFDDPKDHKNDKRLQLETFSTDGSKKKKIGKVNPSKATQKQIFIVKQESDLNNQAIEPEQGNLSQRDAVSGIQSDRKSSSSEEACSKSSVHNISDQTRPASMHIEKKEEEKVTTPLYPRICISTAIQTSPIRSSTPTKYPVIMEASSPSSRRRVSFGLKDNSPSTDKSISQPPENLHSSGQESKTQNVKPVSIFDAFITPSEVVKANILPVEPSQTIQNQQNDPKANISLPPLFSVVKIEEENKGEAIYTKADQSTAKKSSLFEDLSNKQTTKAEDTSFKETNMSSSQKGNLNIEQIPTTNPDLSSNQPIQNRVQQIDAPKSTSNDIIKNSLVGMFNFNQELSSNPFCAVNPNLTITNNPFVNLPSSTPNIAQNSSNQMSLETLMKSEGNGNNISTGPNTSTMTNIGLNIEEQRPAVNATLGGLFTDIGAINQIPKAQTGNSNNLFDINKTNNNNASIGPFSLNRPPNPNLNATNGHTLPWNNALNSNTNFLGNNNNPNLHNGMLHNTTGNLNSNNGNSLFGPNSMINLNGPISSNPTSNMYNHSGSGDMQNENSMGAINNLNTANNSLFNPSNNNGMNNLFGNNNTQNKDYQNFNSSGNGSFIGSNSNNHMNQNHNSMMMNSMQPQPDNLFKNITNQYNTGPNTIRNDLFGSSDNNGIRASNSFNSNLGQNDFNRSNSLNTTQNQNLGTQNLFAGGLNSANGNTNANSTFTPSTTDQTNVFMSGTSNSRVYRSLRGVKGNNGPRLNNIIN